jgi:hypothetical protein
LRRRCSNKMVRRTKDIKQKSSKKVRRKGRRTLFLTAALSEYVQALLNETALTSECATGAHERCADSKCRCRCHKSQARGRSKRRTRSGLSRSSASGRSSLSSLRGGDTPAVTLLLHLSLSQSSFNTPAYCEPRRLATLLPDGFTYVNAKGAKPCTLHGRDAEKILAVLPIPSRGVEPCTPHRLGGVGSCNVLAPPPSLDSVNSQPSRSMVCSVPVVPNDR